MPKAALKGYGLHYRSYGQADRPALLFLHGFMGSSEEFVPIMERLATYFYSVAVDLPGHGQTEVLFPETGYTMTAIAAG
ncbi:MAG: alpha/beta fold hydrolase, partial [Thermosynechococcaceae cyanobacterium]